MRNVLSATLAVLSLVACTTVSASPEQPRRYVYCNVYASTFCFGIAPGDTLNTSIPVDFMIYEVTTISGVSGNIYVGRHPEDTSNDQILNRRLYEESGYRYEYRKLRSGEHEIVYHAADQNAVVAHIRVRSTDDKGTGTLIDFLKNFRPCTMSSIAISCQQESLFAQLLQDGL